MVGWKRLDKASSAQRRMWLQSQLDGGDTSNKPVAWSLNGRLDVGSLSCALDLLVRRHETLRTGFEPVDGVPQQYVGTPYRTSVEPVDVPGTDEAERADRLRALIEDVIRKPFDLTGTRMLRTALFRLAPTRHVLLLVLPNIAVDDWAIGVLQRDLSAAYTALHTVAPLQWPLLSMNYRTYTWREHARLADGSTDEGVGYWTRELRDAPPVLNLPSDRPRPAVPSYRPGRQRVHIDADLAKQVTALAAAHRATPFTVYLAAYQLVLSEWTRSTDILVGVPSANRLLPEVEPLVGFFVNTVVQRTTVRHDESFAVLLDTVRDGVRQGFEHQDVPFDHVLELIDPHRSTAVTPLVQVALVPHRDHHDVPELPGLDVTEYEVHEPTIRFELVTALSPSADGVDVRVGYAADLFDPTTILRFLTRFVDVLRAVVRQPTEPLASLDLMSTEDRERILYRWGRGTRLQPTATSLLSRILTQAAGSPDATAVDTPEGKATFAELVDRARRIAAALRELGAGAEDVIALHTRRSTDRVAALLGVWLAGAAFLPLDPSHPRTRLDAIVADAGSFAVVTDDPATAPNASAVLNLGGPLPRPLAADQSDDPSPDRLAYVVYTSGTTGEPKGVEIEHRGLNNLATATTGLIRPRGGVALNIMAPCFDGWLWSTLLPLAHGLCVAMRDGAAVAAGQLDVAASVVTCTPSLLAASGDVFDAVPTIVLAGEPCPPALAKRWQFGRRLVNAYGPTETTICSTWSDSARGDDTTTIGRPLPNTNAYVLDPQQRPVPQGVPGELFIGGVPVGRGYRGHPELTAANFPPDPFGDPGERMYRTGDLVSWRDDGMLQFLGRVDDQIKVRGYRVEPSEVERVASRATGVRAAAFVVGDGIGLALVGGSRIDTELTDAFETCLPDYLRPNFLLHLDELPLNRSGKLDRAALARLASEASTPTPADRSPRTRTQRLLADLWSEVLDRTVTDVDLGFFEAGGHSLLVAKMVGRVSREWGIRITVPDVLDHPTIAALASVIEARQR